MKKNIILSFLLLFSVSLLAQNKYKYVIIPLQVAEIGDGMNPNGISSSAMKVLNDKGIKSVFETGDIPEDYCQALKLSFENTSSMLRIKLKLELRDCNSRLVWSGEGMAKSKDFRVGYEEAISLALKEMDELPEIKNPGTMNNRIKNEPVVAEKVQNVKTTESIKSKDLNRKISELVPGENHSMNDIDIYRPKRLFFNYKYFLDVLDAENGTKELKIIDGELLGYANLQVIAILSPSGIDNVYTIEWTNPDGSKQDGVANLSEDRLKISIKGNGKSEVISLQKY